MLYAGLAQRSASQAIIVTAQFVLFDGFRTALAVDKDDLELYYKTIPDYFEQDDGRKLTEIPDRTSTDMIEGRY